MIQKLETMVCEQCHMVYKDINEVEFMKNTGGVCYTCDKLRADLQMEAQEEEEGNEW